MLDIAHVRSQFPSLAQTQNGRPVVFFDNPGGTQCPQSVIDAVTGYYLNDNSNHGGAFGTSQRSDAMLDDAHQAMSDMLGASSAREIIFGANMTTLTFAISRSLVRRLQPGDEVVVTRLDHDGNVAPWLLAARDAGASVRWVDVDPADCTLDMAGFARAVTSKTRIVAAGYASNAVGTINDVAAIVRLAHSVGALAYIDAVQYAPHGPIDVQALGCDFLVCSAYKFFGPHEGILYGRADLLEQLDAYKVRPATNELPGKFETGTQNHEGIAGTRAAVEYLAQLCGLDAATYSRRQRIVAGLTAVKAYEKTLSARLIAGLQSVKGVKVWGITDAGRLDWRVPTVSFTMDGFHPRRIAEHLGARGVFVWDGNYYALSIMERLGLEPQGGMLRVGLAHYNTPQEIDRLLQALAELR